MGVKGHWCVYLCVCVCTPYYTISSVRSPPQTCTHTANTVGYILCEGGCLRLLLWKSTMNTREMRMTFLGHSEIRMKDSVRIHEWLYQIQFQPVQRRLPAQTPRGGEPTIKHTQIVAVAKTVAC